MASAQRQRASAPGAGDLDDLEQAVGVVGRLAERAEHDSGDADLTQPPEHRADVVRRRACAVRAIFRACRSYSDSEATRRAARELMIR